MATRKDDTAHQDPQTTGHEWDGIREFDNPLPRWWLWTFYATIVWSVIYTILYPAWPLVSAATPGILGYSTREEVARDIDRFDEMNASVEAKLVEADLAAVPENPDLLNYALNAGEAVFQINCAPCHGAGAAGFKGYPNLLDNAWLWGGTIEAIHTTIRHGIRNDQDPAARSSQMPAWGATLGEEGVAQVVQYVRQISGQEADAAMAGAGAELYAGNCAACHGPDGNGNDALGAPALNDAIWLYGGDVASLTETLMNGRGGVMPPWQGRLSEGDARAVSVYVHQLGGGQ